MRLGLMRNANLLSPDYISKTAADLKLDTKAFAAVHRVDQVRRRDPGRDGGRARRLGVGGTPTFVIGRTHGDRRRRADARRRAAVRAVRREAEERSEK